MNSDIPIEILIFSYIGNILNLAYNIPLVYRVIVTKSANDISYYFLIIRILGSISWLIYAALINDIFVLL